MSSSIRAIRVKFPREQWPGWHIAELNLQSSLHRSDSDCSDSDSNESYNLNDNTRLTLSVDPNTYSDYGSDSPVFRAFAVPDDRREWRRSQMNLTPSQELSPVHHPKTSIALKFAFREDLVDDLYQEAQTYEFTLRSLQGVVVPRCYGFFTGVGPDGQEIACLALEYWGESLRAPFRKLSIDLRLRILDSLVKLHRCGLHHGDFAERNVLVNGNDIRLIDFDQSIYHDCDCEATFELRSRVGTQIPNAMEFGCPVLWEICRTEMAIWE
ncbi:kinase-like domain-containing protein [Lentinula raphanica]|nr:kinase-like domain-containing protein [Lentinula raphanica]